jgi:hypothetical protein
MVTKSGKAPAARKCPAAATPKPAAAKKAPAKAAAASKAKPAAARKPPATPAAKAKAAAVRVELTLEALARGILDKAIRPGANDVQRLAQAVVEAVEKRARKKKAGGKKKAGKKKLAKIPGQKAKK